MSELYDHNTINASWFMNSITFLPLSSFKILEENNIREKIMNILTRRPSTITCLASELGLFKGSVHRHVRALTEHGWIKALSREEASMLGLSTDANRIYYIPSSIFYVAYIFIPDLGIMKLLSNYCAIVDLRSKKFVMSTPGKELGKCSENCIFYNTCSTWVSRICRKLRINVGTDNPIEAMIKIYLHLAYRELKNYLISNFITISSPKINMMYRQYLEGENY